MTQPLFTWTEEDRARLVPGCAVVVQLWVEQLGLCVSFVTVSKVYEDKVFSECGPLTIETHVRHFITHQLAHCDPASITSNEELAAARGPKEKP